MGCSRSVLVKVVLFFLRGRGHPQGHATPNFSTDSKGSIIGLSNDISFVSDFFGKAVKLHKTPRGAETKFSQCTLVAYCVHLPGGNSKG